MAFSNWISLSLFFFSIINNLSECVGNYLFPNLTNTPTDSTISTGDGFQCASEYSAYMTCFIMSGDGCETCSTQSLTEADDTILSDPDALCKFNVDQACLSISCCSNCRTELTAYSKCYFDLLYANSSLSDYVLSCPDDGTTDNNSGGNSSLPNNPDDTDDFLFPPLNGTDNSSMIMTDCFGKTIEFTACLVTAGTDCSTCGNLSEAESFMTAFNNQSSSLDYCDYQNSALCPFITCCSACAFQLQEYFDCFLQLDNNSSDCSLNCVEDDGATGNTNNTDTGSVDNTTGIGILHVSMKVLH